MGYWEQEAERWKKQAKRELQEALDCIGRGSAAFACFYAQQSAEKALKSELYKFREEAMGHDLEMLTVRLQSYRPNAGQILEPSRQLNKYYAETRYPNLHPSTSQAPYELYTREDAETAIRSVKRIHSFLWGEQ